MIIWMVQIPSRKMKREGAELPKAETTETVGRDDARMSNKKKIKLKKKKRNKENTKVDGVGEVGDDSDQQSGKSKGNDTSLLDDEDEVYKISSGDEDETTGMKRWIAEYHHARPGAEVLLQQIDDFLVDYWEQKEKIIVYRMDGEAISQMQAHFIYMDLLGPDSGLLPDSGKRSKGSIAYNLDFSRYATSFGSTSDFGICLL